MKKRLPLILAIAGLVIIIAVASVVYIMYFGAKADKKTVMPRPAPVTAQKTPSPQLPKAPAPVKQDITPPGAPQGAAERAAVPPIAYEYNSKGRRDPFATLIQKTAAPSERKKGPNQLENYDLTEFKVTGILWSKSEYYAVVSAPDGKSYILNEGKKVGLHGGKVYKIVKDSVIVREFLKDYRGSDKPRDTVLKLRREEEG
jgi:Tfp pilus assembly protein PilP